MGLEEQISSATLRNARDASSAHLEALLRVDGARYLRLAHVRDQLGNHELIELKSSPGLQPQLWLDLAHQITMEPDAKTYRLTHHGVDRIDVLLETENMDEAVASARIVLAHRNVNRARTDAVAPQDAGTQWPTLLYIWMTGVVTGGALMAMYYIYMKNLAF